MALVLVFSLTPLAAQEVDARPVVYLTFDDGPSADDITEQVLDLLAYYDARATFFVTGQRTRKNGNKIPAILYAGHAIGNHTDSHAVLTTSSEDEVRHEFEKAGDAVFSAGGPPLTCFRPPFGATDARVNAIAADLGMVAVKWSHDTRDWDSLVEPAAIRSTLEKSTHGSIVLMHDGPAKRDRTLQALREWLATSAHLYQFKALPACQPYGAGDHFASADDQEPDLIVEPETLQSLLDKIRSYRFSLTTDTAMKVNLQEPQLTARLELQHSAHQQ